MLAAVAILAGLMPLVALAEDQGTGDPKCETVPVHQMWQDWVKYRVQKHEYESDTPVLGGTGPGAPYWVEEDMLLGVNGTTILFWPIGNHDEPRTAGASKSDPVDRFNLVGGDYVASPTGQYYYKIIEWDITWLPVGETPSGDHWIKWGDPWPGSETGSEDHTDGCEVTVDVTTTCGGIEATLESNVALAGTYTYTVTLSGGGQSDTASVTGVGSATASLTFDESVGPNQVVVTLSWDEATDADFVVGGTDSQEFTVDTDCEEDPVRYACDAETGTVVEVQPSEQGYDDAYASEEDAAQDPNCAPEEEQPTKYACDADGNVVEVNPGDAGYDDAYDTADEAEANDPNCDDTEVAPTVVTTAPGDVDDEELPFTGLDSGLMGALAAALMAVGVTLLMMTRRLGEDSEA